MCTPYAYITCNFIFQQSVRIFTAMQYFSPDELTTPWINYGREKQATAQFF